MKTRFSRRPLAAAALAVVLVLASGALASSEAATPARQARRQTAVEGVAPTPIASVGHWVRRLLAAAGLLPPPASPPIDGQHAPLPAPTDDNGAGIDPNG